MEESKRKGKTERVMVHVRVRPFNEDEGRSRETGIETIDSKIGSICVRKEADRKSFIFDSVFDQNSQQDEIYVKVGKPVIESVLQGYNSTILTYGQTGTGKTHTMIGGKGETRGVIPRAVQNIFDSINSDPSHSYKVTVGFLQIYMEMIQDLLVPDNPKAIRIREDPEEGVYLSGISWIPVTGLKDCMELMNAGDKNRNTAFTHMNSHSSRSHAVYMVKVEKRVRYTREQLEEIENLGNTPDQSVVSSTLYLVDLAGSERVKKSKAVGSRLDEAKNINLSLLTLGNCIQALADKKVKFVPYRDSKLTRLLEDSLGGNSKTSLIVTVGPSKKHLQETISSLQFGSRAMKVENRPAINKQVDYKSLCSQLQSDLDKIHDNNSHFYIREQELLNEISKLKDEVEKVTTEKEDLEMLLEELKNNSLRASSPRESEEIERTRKSDMKKIQNHYREKLRKQEEEHKKFLEEIDKLMLDQETDLNNMRNDIINLREKNKVLKREKDSIEKSLTAEIKNLRDELDRFQGLEKQVNSRDLEINKLNSELEQIMSQRKLQGNETDKLRSENESLKVGYSKQASDLKSAQDLVVQFEAQVKKMKDTQLSMHKDFHMKAETFSRTVKKYKSGIAESMYEFWKVIQENMQKIGNKNKGLDARIKNLEAFLPKFQDYKQKQTKKMKSLKLEISERLRDVNISKERISQLTINISDLQIISQKHDSSFLDSYKDSKKNISNLLNLFSQIFNQNIVQLYDTVSTQEKKISKLESVKTLIQNLKADKDKTIELQSKSLLEKDSQMKSTEFKLEKLLTEIRSFQKKEVGFRKQIETLSLNLQQKENEISKLIQDKNSLQQELNSTSKSLNESLNSKSSENAALTLELLKKNEAIEELRTDIQKSYTEKIQNLTSVICELKSDIKQKEKSYADSYKLVKKNISESLAASTFNLNAQLSKYTQHIQHLEVKLQNLEASKKLIKKTNSNLFQRITTLQKLLDKTQNHFQVSEQSYKQSLAEVSLLQNKTESELKAETTRLSQMLALKEDETRRLLTDKSMMANNLDSTCRVLNDSLQLQIQQNKTLDIKLEDAHKEISRLSSEVSAKNKELEGRSRELQRNIENLARANERINELSLVSSNLDNSLKINRQTYIKAIKSSKDSLSTLSSSLSKDIQEGMKMLSTKVEGLHTKLTSLEKVKYLLKKKISYKSKVILEKSSLLKSSELELKKTEENYKKLLTDASNLNQKTEQDYFTKLNNLNTTLNHKQDEIQRLNREKSLMESSLDSTSKSLNVSLQSKTKENQVLSESLSSAESEISKLKLEISDHKTAFSKASLSLAQLEKELNSLREDLKAKNQRISNSSSLNSSLQADLKSKERAFIDSFRLSKRNITQLCESSAKNMQTEMKRVSNSIQILEIKIRKLESAKDDIHKNNIKKSLIISKLTSSLKDKENQLINLFSKDKSNYHTIDRLRKDQEEIISNKDNEIQSLREEISGYLNKIKTYQSEIQHKEKELELNNEKLTTQEQSMTQTLQEFKLENNRKLHEAQSRIDSLTLQSSQKDKETSNEIDSLNKLYQETVLNHQQVLDSISKAHKKREDDLLSELEKLSKLLKMKETDYSRLEKKSSSFKSMYDSLKSLVNTLHENLPKTRCRSTNIQSWLLKYLNLMLSQDSSSYHILTSALCIYNKTQNKAAITPQALSQISDMYASQYIDISIESTQDSIPAFREYSEDIYSIMNDMLDLLEAQDMILHEQSLKTHLNLSTHKRPSIFTGNMTDKHQIRKISNIDRLKVPLHNILKRMAHISESRLDSIQETRALSTESINSLFDSPANTDSIKALHEIGETVENMKNLLLNLGSFINLLGGYSSMLLNSNISLEKSLLTHQNLLSSLFSISNYQSIKLHNKQISIRSCKDRLITLSQEYSIFKKNIEEETTITLLQDQAARTLQKFWRQKKKQHDDRIALRNFIKAEKESKNLSSMLTQVSSQTGVVIINSSFSELCSIFTQISFNFLKEDKRLDK